QGKVEALPIATSETTNKSSTSDGAFGIRGPVGRQAPRPVCGLWRHQMAQHRRHGTAGGVPSGTPGPGARMLDAMRQFERDHEAIPHDTAPSAPEWVVSAAPVDYPAAVGAMEARVRAIASGGAAELIWLLEHPALYTAGTSARMSDVLSPHR